MVFGQQATSLGQTRGHHVVNRLIVSVRQALL
jgi:hypothetical protein